MKVEKLLWFGIGLLLLYCCWRALNAKSGSIVAVAGNPIYAEKAREIDQVAVVKHYEDSYSAFNAVIGGRANTVITGRPVGLNLIKEQRRFQTLQMGGDLLHQEMAAVAFKRGEEVLLQAVNRGLADIIENGIYAEISNKYFGLNILEGISLNSISQNAPPAGDKSWKKKVCRPGNMTPSGIVCS